MPRRFVRPACAMAMTSANMSSFASAGLTSTRRRASLVAGVGERVRDAGRDLDDVAGAGDHVWGWPTLKRLCALGDLEALGLDRMDVRDRHRAAGAQGEIEGEQLAVSAWRPCA